MKEEFAFFNVEDALEISMWCRFSHVYMCLECNSDRLLLLLILNEETLWGHWTAQPSLFSLGITNIYSICKEVKKGHDPPPASTAKHNSKLKPQQKEQLLCLILPSQKEAFDLNYWSDSEWSLAAKSHWCKTHRLNHEWGPLKFSILNFTIN